MNRLRLLTISTFAIASLAVTSCDKVKDLAGSAKAWFSDDDGAGKGDQVVDVQSVGKKEGLEIIANESRLVMVEFYSDT